MADIAGASHARAESVEAPQRPLYETKGFLIGVLCLLLAVPVTAWGYLNEPHRLAFWLFVPPLAASFVAIVPTWLVWRQAPGFDGCRAIAFTVLFPILGVPAYLLYFLPVYGAWAMTGMGLGVGQDLMWNYVGIWWAFLLLPSGLLLVSRSAAAKAATYVFPGAESEDVDPLGSYLCVAMPWIGVLMLVIHAIRSERRWKRLFQVFYVGVFFVFPVAWIILGGDAETGTGVPIYFFVFLVFVGLIARALEHVRGTRGLKLKPLLVGWLVMVFSAAIGGTLYDLGWEMMLTPITLALGSITVLPLLYAFRAVFQSASARSTRILWLLALLEYPIAFYPFHNDAKESSAMYSAVDRADELVKNGAHEDAIRTLSEAMDIAEGRGLRDKTAEIALRLASLRLDRGDYDEALSAARRGKNGLKDVPFGWYVPPCVGYRCTGEDPVPRQRELVLDLMTLEAVALMGLGNGAEAVRVGLDAWNRALQAQMWPRLATLAQTFARFHQNQKVYVDAYWWLADARNRIVRGGGPLDQVESLHRAIQDLRESIGDEAFWTAVEECARKDPDWCTRP